MALKTFNPTSPGRRQLVLVDRSELHKGKPVKALTEGLTKKGGRNNKGRITARRIGGGAKKLYRKVDFKRNRWDIPATVERLEYDPNRTAFIALIKYEDGQLSYIIAPQRLEVGDTVITSATADIKPGNTLPLKSIPVGTIIHNIELKPQRAPRWSAPPAPTPSWLAAMVAMPRSSSPRAKLRMVMEAAWRRSVLCPTRTT